MKHLILVIIFPIQLLYSQNDTTFQPSPIFENEIISNSPFRLESKNLGFELINFNSEGCDNLPAEGINRLADRIKTIENLEDSVKVIIAKKETCCLKFLVDIQVKQNDTINLLYETHGLPCKCRCLFDLTYTVKIPGNNLGNLNFQINGKSINLSNEKYRTYPTEFELFQGDTINRIDKYGMRQGYWLVKDSLNRIKIEGIYSNKKEDFYDHSETIGLTGKRVLSYHSNTNQVRSETIMNNGHEYYLLRRYNQEGKIIQECLNDEKKGIWMNCKEY
jgi:hypothetical protein